MKLALGATGYMGRYIRLYNIMATMRQLGVRRLFQVSTSSYRDPQDGFSLSSYVRALFFKVFVRKAYDDIPATGELIAHSELD
ncbi:hypothetical protein ACLB1G_02300 [Oxalobacteraceae bacterium A2-2]